MHTLIGFSPPHTRLPYRTIIGSTTLFPSLPTSSRLRSSYSSGQTGTLGLSAWSSGYSLSVSTRLTSGPMVNSVGLLGSTNLLDATECIATRILACFSQGCDDRDIHNPRHSGQRWWKYLPRVHRRQELEDRRCPIRWRLWRFCSCVCDRELCLWVPKTLYGA